MYNVHYTYKGGSKCQTSEIDIAMFLPLLCTHIPITNQNFRSFGGHLEVAQS